MRKEIGLDCVRGAVLYGPPGTGKTLMARTLSSIMNATCTVVNGPELFDKYVGEAERKVRELFEPAIKDYEANGDDAGLHLIGMVSRITFSV